ncbi:hypothetical protein WA158_007915 [Blastocystis sp. Blastoise]
MEQQTASFSQIHKHLYDLQQNLEELEKSIPSLDDVECMEKLNKCNKLKASITQLLIPFQNEKQKEIFAKKYIEGMKKKVWKRKHRKLIHAQNAIANSLKRKREREIDLWRASKKVEELEIERKRKLNEQKELEKKQIIEYEKEIEVYEHLLLQLNELKHIRSQKQNLIYREDELITFVKQKKEERKEKEEEKIEKQDNKQNLELVKELEVNKKPVSFEEYYFGAKKDINTLISIRKQWDAYIVAPGNGSHIPMHFIQPPYPSSFIWGQYLVTNKESTVS